jgi:hypothetical protein
MRANCPPINFLYFLISYNKYEYYNFSINIYNNKYKLRIKIILKNIKNDERFKSYTSNSDHDEQYLYLK